MLVRSQDSSSSPRPVTCLLFTAMTSPSSVSRPAVRAFFGVFVFLFEVERMVAAVAPAAKETPGPAKITAELFETVLTVGLLEFKDNIRVCTGIVREDGNVGAFLLGLLASVWTTRPVSVQAGIAAYLVFTRGTSGAQLLQASPSANAHASRNGFAILPSSPSCSLIFSRSPLAKNLRPCFVDGSRNIRSSSSLRCMIVFTVLFTPSMPRPGGRLQGSRP